MYTCMCYLVVLYCLHECVFHLQQVSKAVTVVVYAVPIYAVLSLPFVRVLYRGHSVYFAEGAYMCLLPFPMSRGVD